MGVSVAEKASKSPPRTDGPSKTSHARRRNSRTPVERILPSTLIDEIASAVRSAPRVSSDLAEELDAQFEIETRFAVSKRRLRNYMQKLSNGRASPRRAKCVPELTEGTPAAADELRRYRTRQASVASILDATFGPLADCNTDLWDRRAYLMLVGLVYERLALSEDELPTKDLVALAKILAEARRAQTRTSDDSRKGVPAESDSPPTGPLPERFADVVKQVYGTNFHEPGEAAGNGRTPAGGAKPVYEESGGAGG